MECSYCNCNINVKIGIRKNKTSTTQRYYCKICEKRFAHSMDRYNRMRINKFIIDKGLKLRKEGLSYSQIASKINNIVSRQSIYRWVKKYENC